MGVNTTIYLDPTTRLQDVVTVIGILAGIEAEKVFFKGPHATTGNYYTNLKTKEIKVDSCTNSPTMISISINDCLGGSHRQVYWHWESEPNTVVTNAKLLNPRSNPFWIAVGKRLVDFFGGAIQFCDYDDKIDHIANRPRATNFVQSGSQWTDFQDDILNLKPLTLEELHEASKLSAYPTDEEELVRNYEKWFRFQKNLKKESALKKLTQEDKEALGIA